MNIDIRLSVGFWRHPKVFRLEKKLGLKGVRSLQILWCWCAQNRPDGNLADLDASEIEFVADWRGKKGAFIEACAGNWLDETEEGYRLHEWEEYNPYQAQAGSRAEARKEKARNAANARWGKERANDAGICSNDAQAYANDDSSICSDDASAMQGQCSGDATSNAKKMPSLTSTSAKDIKGSLKPPFNPPLQGGADDSAITSQNNFTNSQGKKKSGGNAASKVKIQGLFLAYTENPGLQRALEDFRLMRERLRKPLTERGAELCLLRLNELAGNDVKRKTEIVNQSVLHSWQGLFPLRQEAGALSAGAGGGHIQRFPPGGMSLAQQNMATAMAVLKEMEAEDARAS